MAAALAGTEQKGNIAPVTVFRSGRPAPTRPTATPTGSDLFDFIDGKTGNDTLFGGQATVPWRRFGKPIGCEDRSSGDGRLAEHDGQPASAGAAAEAASAGTPPVPSARLLGFWMCVALVVGNMIGSGVFLLPASLAPYGLNSIVGWVFTAAGAMLLALVFAALGRSFPTEGGPYAFVRMAFGDLPAFIVAWGYWISIWAGNAAIATGTAAYLGQLIPAIAPQPTLTFVTVAMVWLLTAVNLAGARTAGNVQLVTTVLKVTPLLAIAGLGLWLLAGGNTTIAAAASGGDGFRLDAVTAAAALTLWAMLGLESATVPAGKVADPERTIPRATLVGTAATALIYVVACTTVILLIPAERLAQSSAPFAEAASMFWGAGAGQWIAAFAVISGFGALNGWILLQGELPLQMARNGVFPKIFARQSRRQTPVAGLLIGSVLMTIMLLMNSSRSTVQLFSFVILLATAASLVLYLACSLAMLKLLGSGRMPGGRRTWLLGLVGASAAAYSLWAIYGAGLSTGAKACGGSLVCWAPWAQNPVVLGFVLLALGVPVYYAMRLRRR